MAIIREEQPQHPLRRTASTPPLQKPEPRTRCRSPATSLPAPNPFKFWFYLTLTVSLITLITHSLSYHQDPKSWFLSLPTSLHTHYASGRTIKIQYLSNLPHIELFTLQNTLKNSQNALFVHGLGFSSYGFRKLVAGLGRKGVSAVAIDLPGSGFSDKSVVVEEESSGGVFGGLREVYNEIREKGLFWGFDQLVEKGYVDQEEIDKKKFKREVVKPIELGSEEMGRVLGQVIETLGLAPVDLVLHDSALGLSANWVLENTDLVRSLTLIDTSSSSGAPAFPLWVLEMPVVREVVLGFGFVFKKVVESCCSKSITGSDLEAHRALLIGRDGRKAVVGMGRNMNCSFDLMEWGSSIEAKGLPMQVIWSNDWSKEWKEEGDKVANSLPKASCTTHSGGRWPQDDVKDELTESISQFLSNLPKSIRLDEDEPVPGHIQKMLDEAIDNENHHHQGHGGHSHDHVHPGYTNDAYGLGNAWAS